MIPLNFHQARIFHDLFELERKIAHSRTTGHAHITSREPACKRRGASRHHQARVPAKAAPCSKEPLRLSQPWAGTRDTGGVSVGNGAGGTGIRAAPGS